MSRAYRVKYLIAEIETEAILFAGNFDFFPAIFIQ